jgi:Lon-like ATP-dependent protease
MINSRINYNCLIKKSFAKKNLKAINPSIDQGLDEFEFIEDPTFKNQKVHQGEFNYLPINDHPLIPGYTRFLPISMKLAEKIKNLTDENSEVRPKIIMSVIKDTNTPQLNLQMRNMIENVNFIPEITSSNQVFEIGCVCEIQIAEQRQTGTSALIVPLSICRIDEFTIEPSPNELGKVKATIYKEIPLNEEMLDSDQQIKYQFLKKLLEKTIAESKDENFMRLLIALKQNYNTESLNDLINISLASLSLPKFFHKYGFLTSEITTMSIQQVLEQRDIFKKLDLVTKLFSSFSNKIELWEKLEYEYDHNKEKTKINEKLQSIYQNLKTMFETDKDEKSIQVERFKKNMEGKNPPEAILKIFKEELERFMSMDKHSMESNLIRNYLDVLTSLPYGIYTEDNLDIINAKKILEETHYGMESVKQRILECIAVAKLKNKTGGKILCFSGPPGVGKTSIAESIAKSLGRKFHRIALGGDKDTSSLKGFRRTYVGSMPGKIINALKKTGSENPVILLDEIDKLTGRNHQGDPSSVLLEVLDPEQNYQFTDDYLDVAVDLSKVFFLCTANDLSYVPQPLLDRMEIIDVSGYTSLEKKYIYDKHLKSKGISLAGLEKDISKFNVTENAITKLISDYCRESGIRSLQRYTNRIYEKIAYKLVSSTSDSMQTIEVNENNLKQFIGQAHFSSKRIYDVIPKGVSIGLGFNNYGGTILYIEANKSYFVEGKNTERVTITGNVGKVMNESCSIAISFAKNYLNKIKKIFFEENAIHLHFIEGAIEKDGPSAGTAITTALLSLALDISITNNLAMTGEISLLGKVLPIGGVKEKVMAAKREGMTKIILPRKNMDDALELPDYIKDGLEFYYVEDYDEVFKLCFPNYRLD